MLIALALHQWADIAQLVIAIVAFFAFWGAVWQVLDSRANAKRVRVYEYSDRFNQLEMRRSIAEYREYWQDQKQSYEDFMKLTRVQRNELLMLPNLIEEVAALYHRRLIDRDVAAEVLGIYVENLWAASQAFVARLRTEHTPNAFVDWEEMQRDTPGRRLKANKKIARRRAWRKLLRG